MKKKSILNIMLSLLIGLSVFVVSPSKANDIAAAEKKTVEYVAKEDAFVRSGGKANTNYDFENITSAHGAQYAGKGYTVINSKNSGSDQIIGIMKFDLPTQQEIDDNAFNSFALEFNVFKNAGYTGPAQDYGFYYTTDVSWNEKSITWNNKPASISRDSENEIFSFHTNQGDEYEVKSDSEKRVTTDVTATIKKLVEDGNSEITVFVVGKQNSTTSLLMHSKETSAKDKAPKLIATNESYSLDNLKALVTSVSGVKQEEYTIDTYTPFSDYVNASNKLIAENSADEFLISTTYRNLKKAYDGLEKVVIEDDNIAFNKPTRSNLSKLQTNLVTDGDTSTAWAGTSFPAYVDIDLMDTYKLEKLQVYVPVGKIIYYTIYGSNDGNNYDRLYQHRTDEVATEEGQEIVFDTPQSYRIVRVFLEFTDGAITSHLSEVKAYGEKTDSNTATLRDGSLEEILNVKSYNESEYAAPITKDETIENVYGIIDRTIGSQYRDWFSFEIADETSENDYFELSDVGGKIHIKGNEGLSLTTGLNYYFKNYVKVHISEQTMQVKMPDTIVPIGTTVRKETPYQVRYAFNYCTLSYTFAFFGKEEWQRENDWLALNGVNVVLDLAGQEATWIQFLMNFGYSYDDAKDWLTGPAYSAWQFMNNMETLGGPVPDGYVKDRLELARSSQRWKNSLGMQTVLQGYGGMVPTNFNEFQPDVAVTKQKNWGGNLRPSMIATDSTTYDDYAEKFYAAQEYVYGKTTDYYAVDPYHEGGTRPAGLSDETVSKEVLESLLKYDKDAVWVVQAWQSNPTNGLLKGMGELRNDHVLIVDLIKYPIKSWTKYNKTKYGSTTLDSKEFNGTDWAWCLLGNFGGNPTMNGQMQVMVEDILKAQKESKHMKGIGIISEGTYDNPMLYDLIFDLAWADDSFDLNQWMNNYIERRYGGISENARLAWQTIKGANYNQGVRHTEEIFGLKNSRPQFQGTKSISYGADKLETAFKLLIKDYDKFKDSECYLYDLREIMRQHVSNYAVLSNNKLLEAKNSGSLEDYKAEKEKFLKAFDVLNEVQATDKDQLAGEWIGKATDLVADYDDFSKDLFKINAKTLITTWGTNPNAGLKEYGWRNYEGMFLDLTKHHWEEYVNLVENDMENGTTTEPRTSRYHFDYEWKWVLGDQEYTRDAKNSPEEVKKVVDQVVENCSITDGLSPDAGNIALNMPVETNTDKISGKSRFATDGNQETTLSVSASKDNDKVEKPEIIIDLVAEFQLTKLNLVFENMDDTYYNYEIYVSTDKKNWKKINERTSDELHSKDGDIIEVSDEMVRFVKVVGTKDSKHLSNPEKTKLSIEEIRAYGERTLPDADQLNRFITAIGEQNVNSNSTDQINQLKTMIQNAKDVIEQDAGPDEFNSAYWNLYDYLITLDLHGMVNIALNKPVSAHNDPSGESSKINDGNEDLGWNSGRLSPTGKPYQHDPISPGWAIIDLEDVYDIEEINIKFPSGNLWYKYEIYVSENGEDWEKYAEKTTENKPNSKEDDHYIDKSNVRYVKMVTTDITVGSDGKRASYGVRELEVYGTPHKDVNVEELQKLVDEASKLKEDEYTADSWKTFKDALDEATAIIDNKDATQGEVDAAYEKLSDAKDNLAKKTVVDTTKLEEVIAQAKTFDLSKYEDEGVNKLQASIAKAEDLIKGTPTQEVVDAMIRELLDGISALKPKDSQVIDTTKLNDLINSVSAFDLSKYTLESVNVLNKALSNAKGVVNSATTQSEIDAAYNELLNAVSSLKLKTPSKDVPKPGDSNDSDVSTGDTTNVLLLITMMALSLGYIMYRKKEKFSKK